MSEQRKLRMELKQGLHQYLMGLYVSYTESQGEDKAKELVLGVINEEYQYFSPQGLEETSTLDVLTEKSKELTNKMESLAGDYDMQIWYAEKVDALNAAREIIEQKIS